MRLRRSELSVPASNEHMIEKAVGSSADLVLLDLEDSVAPDEKAAARTNVIKALKTLDWGKKTRAYRINDLGTEYAYQDIISVVEEAGAALDIIIVPKVKSAKDVWWVDVLLTQIEKRLKLPQRIGLEVLIEEVEAIVNLEEIALSSPRLEALIFGPADYSASQGMDSRVVEGQVDEYPGDPWHYVRSRIVIAARLARIDAIDGTYGDFKNAAGYRREATRARVLGFAGKWAIHPNQLALANEIFSPTPEQVAYARRLNAVYTEALEKGLGAIAFEGKMVDVAVVRGMQSVLQKADLIGM